MAIERLSIDKFILLIDQHPLFDVRSPGEYNHAHIPGANNLPLFSDEERKIVGTAYKQKSREEAIKIGLDYFGPRMRTMVEEAEKKGSKQVLVYCWRGGMRSAGVAWLLDLYGFKVYTLSGGYKSFRNHVLTSFTINYRLNILGGFTGSGKTELLRSLEKQAEPVIDLEALAIHKGSAFGSIGLPPQPSQEMFENLLSMELTKIAASPKPIWLEDESQRIGLVNIPNALWKNMRNSPVFFLDIPFEERLKHITEEYGKLDKEKLKEAIVRIKERLGGLNAKNAIALLDEGNTLESFRILLNYYDKFYHKSLYNRENINSLLENVSCESVSPENANLVIHASRSKAAKV
ncbi:MAG: tRNA 2-selenouridine(34) synthase MnmH [Chitinophagaceae bacterium]|nr:tRNA 2-selenouridine(34) synthase MnmH [Chitinophagaceae bacterium]